MIPFLLSLTSLPLLLPTSISSSLNLLLLNFAYTTLVLSYHPLQVELFAVLGACLAFYLLPTALMAVAESLFPNWRIKPTRVKPAKRWKGREFQVARGLLNVALAAGIEIGLEYVQTEMLEQRSFIRVGRTLPLVGSLLWDLLRVYLIRNVLYYTIHRFVLHHTPKRARNNGFISDTLAPFAAQHKSCYHASSPPPSPLTPLSDGPLAFLALQFIPVYLPCALLHVHILTYTIFLALTNLEVSITHSFLQFPAFVSQVLTPLMLLPWRVFGVKGRVERHWIAGGRREYEGWGVLDWVGGTGRGKGEGWEEGMERVREGVDKSGYAEEVEKAKKRVTRRRS
ncbi:hypothetical protein BJ508DRAFT_412942 [Ascobolus immersus RN42]|uniref:Fatty acid hydroxylase domain-containing protein n=1 Tax=Ascobolus immersus RN42 TaxID=1160509 RepID=A0A3N4IFN0_ASCIM|nr:hypothetical protein BJ508DRAFT_412942 [Ascobolus immersus RN42]